MKRSAIVTFTTVSTLSLLFPLCAFANVSVNVSGNSEGSESNVNVHQEGSSQTTTCVNGNCSTTGSGGSSTVCHNGDCKTYDGDVHYESEDGHTKVTVENANGGTLTPRPTEVEDDTNENEKTEPKHHWITRSPEPTSTSASEKFQKKITKKREELKHMIKAQNSGFSTFFSSFEKFFSSLFH